MRNWTYGLVTILFVLAGCQQAKPEKQVPKDGNASAAAPKPAEPAKSPIKPGVYGNVDYNEEGGDLVGAELQIPERSDQPIEITLCEGDCSFVVRAPYVVKGNAIEFTYRGTLVDGGGKAEDVPTIHFRLEPRGKNLALINQPVSGDVPPEVLKPLPKRDSLDYALEQMKEHGLRFPS